MLLEIQLTSTEAMEQLMPGRPAARVKDPISHSPPPTLTGTGSPNVFIGKQPAWRGIPATQVSALQAAKKAADSAVQAAEAATIAALGTPGLPAAKASEEAVKTSTGAAMSASVMAAAAGGGDIHTCSMPLVPVTHGPGVVINGSTTVFINRLPAARADDTVVEALGPPHQIVAGEASVLIGG